jgi:hypothetical protein
MGNKHPFWWDCQQHHILGSNSRREKQQIERPATSSGNPHPKNSLRKKQAVFSGWRTREARRKERGCVSHVGHKRMDIGGYSLTKHSQQIPTGNKQPSSLHDHLSNEELQGLEGGRKTDHDLSRSLRVDYHQTE